MGGALQAVGPIVTFIGPFLPYPFNIIVTVAGIVLTAVFAQSQTGKRAFVAAQTNFAQRLRDRSVVIRGSIEPGRVVYGRAKVGGVLVFVTSTGDSNKYLHLVVALTMHEVEAFEAVFVNDQEISISQLDANGFVKAGRFKDKLRLKLHRGTPNEAADPDLVAEVPEWTTAHRGQEVAYLYARCEQDDKAFPSGVPNFAAVLKGKNDVLDDRTATAGYTNNANLCIADFIRSPLGFHATVDEVDVPSIISEANICDEDVLLLGGGTQKRYTCDGIISLDEDLFATLQTMLTCMAGRVVFTQWAFKFFAGAYRTPSVTIDQTDLDAGTLVLTDDMARQERFNRVVGTFMSERDFWEPDSFPAVENAAYEIEDGETITKDIELQFTMDHRRAQRIAKLHLEQSRLGAQVEFPGQPSILDAPLAENITLSLEFNGHVVESNSIFTVMDFKHDPQAGVSLVLRRDNSSAYSWSPSDEKPLDPRPVLPDPEIPPGVVANLQVHQIGTEMVQITWLEIAPVPDGYIIAYGPPGEEPLDAIELDRQERGTQIATGNVPPGSWIIYIWGLKDGIRSEIVSSKAINVANFNDIIYGVKQAPNWTGARTNFVVSVSGALIANSALAANEHTKEELWEQFLPYPVAESIYEVAEIDLGFDAAAVRMFADYDSGLGRGVTEGEGAPDFQEDHRLSTGFYDGFEPITPGLRDLRYAKFRIFSDNTTGKRVVRKFDPTLDVQEQTLTLTNVVIPVGGASITFPERFHKPPIFQPTLANGLAGFVLFDQADVTTTGVNNVTVVDSILADIGGIINATVTGALGKEPA